MEKVEVDQDLVSSYEQNDMGKKWNQCINQYIEEKKI